MSNNPKVRAILNIARAIENSQRNIQRSLDRESKFKGEKEMLLKTMGKGYNGQPVIPSEAAILEAAALIQLERRQDGVRLFNRARIERLEKELERATNLLDGLRIGPDFEDIELSEQDADDLARAAGGKLSED